MEMVALAEAGYTGSVLLKFMPLHGLGGANVGYIGYVHRGSTDLCSS